MRRMLLKSSSFERGAKRIVRKKPQLIEVLRAVLALLAEDDFHPSLKTHKLQGNLEGSWSCSAAYDLRIVFSFVVYLGSEAILLEAVGTHDEVY